MRLTGAFFKMTTTDLLFAEDAKAASRLCKSARSLRSRDRYTSTLAGVSIILLIAVPPPYWVHQRNAEIAVQRKTARLRTVW
jgi:hypothetical protein